MTDNFNIECIKTHNELRSLHRAPYLVNSKKLSEESQKWAIIMAAKSELKHSSTNGIYGENIAISNFEESGEDITLRWYKEVIYYKFGQERQIISKIGHFSQVIWNDSVEAGFGRAMAADGKWYIVGRYKKAGNVIGNFIQNINPYITGWHNNPLIKKMNLLDKQQPRKVVMNSTNKSINIEDEYDIIDETSEIFLLSFKSDSKSINGKVDKSNRFHDYSTNDRRLDSVNSIKTVNKANIPISEEEVFHSGDEVDIGAEVNMINDCDSSIKRDIEVAPKVFETNFATEDAIHKIWTETSPVNNSISSIKFQPEDKYVEDFREEILQRHNKVRQRHGVNHLKLNGVLNEMAQKWADKMKETVQLQFTNEKYLNEDVGENIAFMLEENLLSGEYLVNKWYNEAEKFDYGSEPRNFDEIGHFTQMVWSSSSEMGVGVSSTNKNTSFVVCLYFPAGNIKDHFSNNVRPVVDL